LVPQHENLEIFVAVAWPRTEDQVDEECDEMSKHEPEHPALLMAPTLPATRSMPQAMIADYEASWGRTRLCWTGFSHRTGEDPVAHQAPPS